ncbi:MAG: ATPase [Methanosphaera sp.]|nr:ATPase [Methanosphaera sp.]
MSDEYRTIIKSLNKIGVDTRYISLYDNTIYINNLKFSKFSKKRQESFNKDYPDIQVVRSKVFQKICIKTSRSLKNMISPHDEIYISNSNTAEDILLNIVLEPYKRKYGIIITHDDKANNIIASSKCLDDFANEYINLMIDGNKITDSYEENTIYPLIHVSREWINEWINQTGYDVEVSQYDNTISQEVLDFLETHIPNVCESIKQSVTYLDDNRIK